MQPLNDHRRPAMLVVGPTACGKSPLGACLEERGLFGRRCLHFDFGANLRAIAGRAQSETALSPREYAVVCDVLRSGTLLDNEHFPIALKILESYLHSKAPSPRDIVVLNGMPRHVGQAEGVDKHLRVLLVIQLACSPATVIERIRRDTGGDRKGRPDDALPEVQARLRTFEERTAPMLNHYRTQEVPVLILDVEADTTAQDLYRSIVAHQDLARLLSDQNRSVR